MLLTPFQETVRKRAEKAAKKDGTGGGYFFFAHVKGQEKDQQTSRALKDLCDLGYVQKVKKGMYRYAGVPQLKEAAP